MINRFSRVVLKKVNDCDCRGHLYQSTSAAIISLLWERKLPTFPKTAQDVSTN